MTRLRLLLRKVRDRRGSVTILVAVTVVALLGFAALGTDVGRLFLARQHVGAVADAAAISGAQYLPQDRDGAVAAVQTYLQKNGVDPTSVTIQMNDTEQTLTVTVVQKVTYTFARIFGVAGGHVEAQAVARTAPVTGSRTVVPLGVVRQDWNLGDPVVLKASPGTGGTLSPGNYGALSLGGTGASNYEQNLEYGYTGWVRVGDYVTTETGNMAGPTDRALQYRIGLDPFATYGSVTKGSSRIMILPVLDTFQVNGRGEVKVVGLAAFFLDSVGGQGNESGTVRGRFLRYIVQGESDGTGADFATYTIKLTY